MNNMKIATRLGLVLGLLAVLLAVIGGEGLSGVASSNASPKNRIRRPHGAHAATG